MPVCDSLIGCAEGQNSSFGESRAGNGEADGETACAEAAGQGQGWNAVHVERESVRRHDPLLRSDAVDLRFGQRLRRS